MTNSNSKTNPAQGAGIVYMMVNRSFLQRLIYRLMLISIVLLFAFPLNAAIYYVSATGNDANTGTSTSAPWRTLAKVNSFTPKPGDQILFKRGDSWIGTITVKASGTSASPITYGAWGEGANPVISGFTTVTGWTNEGNGIYSKLLTVQSNPEIVTVNGVQYAMGRTPNSDRNNLKYSDYYHIDSYSGTTSITDSECNASATNWTGAEIVIRGSNQMQWGRFPVTNHSGTTLTFSNPSSYSNAVGYGYFIQNDLKTLDQFGEWYYGGGKFYMYFGMANPNNFTIKVSTTDRLIDIGGRDFITVKHFLLEGANVNAIETDYAASAYNLTVENCNFDVNHRGIYGHMAIEMTVKNCSFKRSSFMAVYNHWYSDGTYFGYNTIDSTGLVIGAGTGDFYSGIGVLITYSKNTYSKKNTIIEYNNVTNSGYMGINFSGDGTIVRYNYVDTYCLNKSDGGGIYYGNRKDLSNMIIDNNIVLNGIQNNETHGLPLNTTSNKQYNIYLDYYSTGFTITNNTVAFCQGGAGIMLHGSQNVVIKNNTVYDCAIGVRFQELDGLGSPTRNVTLDNNVIFAKTLSQLCVLARSTTNDFNQYGTFANNHYAKPIDNTNAFATLLNTWANTYHNLSGWKSYTSLDASSKMASQTITNVNDLLFEYNSTASPKTVSLNQPMTDARGTKYSTSITLQPFSSAVLMKDLNPVLADLTKPVITVFTIPANSSSLVVPINNFTVVSNQPVTGYKLTESASAPLAVDAGWTATSPVYHTFSSLGTKTLYAWVKDAAGNVSAGISAQVDIQKALGYNEVYASSTTNSPRMAMPVTVSETGQINSISIYHNGGTDNLILGVYSDQSGIPGSRLAITASTAVNPKAGWQTVPLTSPVTVNSGQKVWLAWVFQKNPGIRYTIGTPGRAASTSYWPPELPSIFGTSTIANNKFSVYCNYMPSNDLSDVTKPVVNTFTLPSTSLSLTVSVTSFTASDNKGVTGYLLTETSTAPLAINTGWSASAPSSYTFASEGTKTLYAWAKDAAGNVSASLSNQVTITLPDVTKPLVTAFTIPSTAASLTVSVTSFTASDNKGITGYLLTETSTAPLAGNTGWSASAPSSYTFASEGTKTLYAWAKDAAGNVSASLSNQVTITLPDVTKPLVTAFTIPSTAASLTVSVTSFTASDNKGITGYLLTETSTAPLAGNTGWSASAPSSYTFASEGTKTLYAWAKDAAGNVSASLSNQVTITLPDVTKPLVTAFTIPSTAASLTVSVTSFTASDNKGVTGYLLTEASTAPLAINTGWSASAPSSYTFASEGTKTLYAWAKDAAGNVSASLSNQVTITLPDVTKPLVTAFTIPSTAASLTVSVTSFTASDNKGITGYLLTETSTAPLAGNTGWSASAPSSYTFASEGTKTLYAWAKDAAGNVSASLSNQVTITLPDVTKPLVTAFTIPSTAASLTVSVTSFTASDNKGITGYLLTETSTAPLAGNTGWSASAPSSYTFASEGTKTLYAWAKDAAGNVSASLSNQVTITLPDVTKPLVTAFTIPSTAASLTVSVTSFTASDNKGVTGYLLTETSTAPLAINKGWSASAPSSYTFASEGTKTLYAWAKDAAGNVSASLSNQVTITLPDVTKPLVTAFTIPSTAASLTVSVTSFTASDNKGVTGYLLTETSTAPLAINTGWSASAPSSYTFASEGTKTLYAWTKDAAGNVSSSLSNQVTIELIRPAIVDFSVPDTSASLIVPIIKFEVNDTNIVTGYIIKETSDSPDINDANWKSNAPTTYSFSENQPGLKSANVNSGLSGGEILKTLYAWTRCARGNISVCVSDQVVITIPDETKPVVNDFSIPETSSSLLVSVTNFNASDNIGVTGYILTESATAPLAANTAWSVSSPASYTFALEGTKTLYAWVKDAAGNVSASISAQVIITLPEYTPGNTEVYSNSLKWGNQLAMPVKFNAAGEIKSISIYHEGGTGNVLLGVYSDKGGYPSSRLGITATTAVSPGAGWQTIQLSTPVPVISGQKVWLSWVFQNAPAIRYTAGTPGRAASSNTWTNGMPASFGSSTIASNKYSIYCTLSTLNNPTDEVIPVVTAFNIPSTSTSLTVPVSNFTAVDNTGVAGYLLTESATAPQSSNSGWSLTVPASYFFTTAGTKTLYAWVKDAAGNVSASLSAKVIITLPVNAEIPLGNTDVYSNTLKWGNQLAMPVSFNEAGEIKSIAIYHEGGIGNFLLSVYSDQGGLPSTRTGITASTAVNPTAGWQTVQLTNPVRVISGQKVWLSWVFQNAPGIRYAAGTPGRAASSNTWANGMPETFGKSTIAPNKYSIYCNFIPDITKSGQILTENKMDMMYIEPKVYPNPFTDRLRFEFVSPESVNARIDLFDMTGRLVNTIFEQKVEAEILYEAEFRPTITTSAFYMYRITLGNNVTSGKVIFKKE
jgi:hypothetical protein